MSFTAPGPSSTLDRSYTPYYTSDKMCILRHANGICVLCVAPQHELTKATISKVDFEVKNNRNYLNNKVIGKGKKGAMKIEAVTKLCRVTVASGEQFVLRPGIQAKLMEVNERLIEEPGWIARAPLGKGYLAVILPTSPKIEKSGLMGKEEYLKKLDEKIDE